MKSLILDKGERYYTYLEPIFEAIQNEQKNYNWLISDFECYPTDCEAQIIFNESPVWISGEKLTEIVEKNKLQFIWGVFTGFSKDIELKEIQKYPNPVSEGNTEYWGEKVKLQHPLAQIEIVAWDSSLTLFLSKRDELAQYFQTGFPLSEDLEERNMKEMKSARV